MALPQMHARTHIPVGYAAVVEPFSDPADLIDQATTDQVPCVASASATDSAYMTFNDGLTVTNANTQNVTGYADGVAGTAVDIDLVNGKFEIGPGIWLLQAVAIWGSAFTGGKMVSINTASGNILQDTNFWEAWNSATNTGTGVDTTTTEALMFVTTGTVLAQVKVRQTNGSSQFLSQVEYSIVKLGTYS